MTFDGLTLQQVCDNVTFTASHFGSFYSNVCPCVCTYVHILSLDWIFAKSAFLWQPGHTRRYLDKDACVLDVQSEQLKQNRRSVVQTKRSRREASRNIPPRPGGSMWCAFRHHAGWPFVIQCLFNCRPNSIQLGWKTCDGRRDKVTMMMSQQLSSCVVVEFLGSDYFKVKIILDLNFGWRGAQWNT